MAGPEPPETGPDRVVASLAGPGAVVLALAWASWPSLREMVGRWSTDPRYSHGFLVPIFAAYLLRARLGILAGSPRRPRPVWGLALIGSGLLIGLAGARFYLNWAESISLLPCLAGLAVLAGGWTALRWAGPSICFLTFMVPLPYRFETALGAPLQRLATLASTYALQTVGLPAVAEGNIILIDDARIGVVEACNGLGMLMMFLAFASGVVLIHHRWTLDSALILACAAPIALLANIARITSTGLLHHLVGGKTADAFYHDFAGWLMMPLALVVFGALLKLLSRLFVEPGPKDAGPVDAASGLRPSGPRWPIPGNAAGPTRPARPEGGR